MELNFGGPVWHASVMAATRAQAEAMAERALDGVGDAALGEWREFHKALHIRRRLSSVEQQAHKLEMLDLRGTPEGQKRIAKLIWQHPRLKLFAEHEMKGSS